MVKMFLIHNRVNISTRAEIGGLKDRVPNLMEEADAEYQQLLQHAINFCNLDLNPGASPQDKEPCKDIKKT